MSSQYPFSGNPYAQADPSTSHPNYSSYAPQSNHPQHPQQNNNNDNYADPYADDYQDRYGDPNNDNTLRNERTPYSANDNDEKLPAVGTITSPYARDQSLDYSDRKGIWTRDDKRAFQKRGVAAKIFRSVDSWYRESRVKGKVIEVTGWDWHRSCDHLSLVLLLGNLGFDIVMSLNHSKKSF